MLTFADSCAVLWQMLTALVARNDRQYIESTSATMAKRNHLSEKMADDLVFFIVCRL